MKNTNYLNGMPVVCNGARIARVLSVQLTPDLSRMAGLHVDRGLGGRRYIPAERVRLMGELAVLVEPGYAKNDAPPALPRLALSPDGAHIGCITGAWLEETGYGVESLELSGGILQDLFTGRMRVRRYHVQKEKGEVIIDEEELPRRHAQGSFVMQQEGEQT
ncbi:MAG: hypothetical protein Q4A66_02290 [Eubacteriales bacterium]|nr:hypothetical protein [Eubacteriales bacterium]